ncbi:ThuA domain-containing protein [Verrucomicrobiota bacterium]
MNKLWVVIISLVLGWGLCVFAQQQKKKAPKKPKPDIMPAVIAAMSDTVSVEPVKPRKILVFWLCQGWKHGSISAINKTFEIMSEKTKAFDVVLSDDMSMFDAENLKQFDAIVLNNTTKLKFENPAHKKSFIEFVKGGKGVMGIHAAVDNFYDWPEAAEMMGGLFAGHPWTAGGTWAIKLDEPDHPLNKAFKGEGFKIKDEIYMQKDPFSRKRSHVLLSMDLSDEKTAGRVGGKNKREDNDYAVAWIHSFGEGRVFYTSLGHNNAILTNSAVLQHYLDGVQYVTGDLILTSHEQNRKF